MNAVAHGLMAFELLVLGAAAIVGGSLFGTAAAFFSAKPHLGFLPDRATGLRIGGALAAGGFILCAAVALIH